MEKLIECPFCKSENVELYHRIASKDPLIWCHGCNLMVCSMQTIGDKSLSALWNNRR